jgi:hypothetical protein
MKQPNWRFCFNVAIGQCSIVLTSHWLARDKGGLPQPATKTMFYTVKALRFTVYHHTVKRRSVKSIFKLRKEIKVNILKYLSFIYFLLV